MSGIVSFMDATQRPLCTSSVEQELSGSVKKLFGAGVVAPHKINELHQEQLL